MSDRLDVCRVSSVHSTFGSKPANSWVDAEFRQTIEERSWKISACANEMLRIRNNKKKRKADFLKEIVEKEKEIFKRNQELKDMIDRLEWKKLTDIAQY